MSIPSQNSPVITRYVYICNRMPSAMFSSLDAAESAAEYQLAHNHKHPVSYYRLYINKVTGYEQLTHIYTYYPEDAIDDEDDDDHNLYISNEGRKYEF